ncbi:VOC family protein [Planctomonas sp. JC2975]|uniref:VOC family protein n=1 Tax=Planctomonas sp. JC2975 TaxID=2729626 RepID=UPI0014759BB8|nr:VOC family protein [Planctomonas sp. JC2975]NNC13967.1 VOC family protein [Planctomonas sp. JC2975]
MFSAIDSFSGFSVDDLQKAKDFYGTVLGLQVESEGDMGIRITQPSGAEVFIYGKPNHTPASFTILNFVVDDIDTAVDELNAAGVTTKIYSDSEFPTDAKGIARPEKPEWGPDIAWFRDPAGNVLAVIQA